jgi:hypothetical protein
MKRTRRKKSRDTVPLWNFTLLITSGETGILPKNTAQIKSEVIKLCYAQQMYARTLLTQNWFYLLSTYNPVMAVFSFLQLISLIIHISFVKLGPFNHVLKILFCLAVQCSRSVPFWSRSGFADPYHGLADPDPDSAILVSDLQDVKT